MNRLALIIASIVLLAPTALGHAEPYEASPGWNQRLDESPGEVVVTFTEPVYEQGSWIRVRDLAGNRVDLDDLQITNGPRPVMRLSLPPLEDGGYLIRWQTYSQTDGHTIGGAIGFSIGSVAPPESTLIADETSAWAIMARALSYAGYVVALGGLAFQFLVLRTPWHQGHRGLDAGLLLGAGAHAAGVLLLLGDTAAATGLGFGAFLAGEGGRGIFARLVLALLVLGVSALWLKGPVRPRMRYMALAVLWLLAVYVGASLGHAMGPAAHAVQFVHGVAIASWVGGLVFFVAWLWNRDDAPAQVGQRFGTLGIAATVLMAITGLYLSATILGPGFASPSNAYANPYRSILTTKIVLVLAMIGLAAVNRFVVLRKEPKSGGGALRKLVASEAAIGVIVVCLAGALMSLAAPADGLEETQSSYEQTRQGFDLTGTLRIDPEPVEGRLHDARLFLVDDQGAPLVRNDCAEGRDDCVQLMWYADAEGAISGQKAVGVPNGDGWWLFGQILFAESGNHTLVVEASSAYTFQDELTFEATVLQAGRD